MLNGKTALIYGVANDRSLAWAIAQALSGAGARLALTYQGERMQRSVRDLADRIPNTLCLDCDVTNDEQIAAVADTVDREMGGLDILVHSVAFARKEELAGRFVDTSRGGYHLAQEVSAYSLVAVTRPVLPLFEKRGGGSVIALTYLGAERVVPNYNVMGIAKAALEAGVRYLAADLGRNNVRVNGISAGPVKTLAARGISGFNQILSHVEELAPLRRNITSEDVGNAALFLASDLSRSITGEILHVDSGYHIMAL